MNSLLVSTSLLVVACTSLAEGFTCVSVLDTPPPRNPFHCRDNRKTTHDARRHVLCAHRSRPFQSFEDDVLVRIGNAQDSGHIHPVGVIGNIESCFVKESDLTRLASSAGDDEWTVKERSELAKKLHDNGGYLIVELGLEESKIIECLWKSADDLFLKNQDEVPFRHQTLVRDGTSASAKEHSGYKYVETSIRRLDCAFSFIPSDLSDIVGEDNTRVALEAYQLLTRIGNLVVTASLMGFAGDSSIQPVVELMETVADDGTDIGLEDEAPLSCSVHRICRYPPVEEFDDAEAKENLRSHTDWTLATLVPASRVPGLEIWHPSMGSWTRPELTSLTHWKEHSSNDLSSDKDDARMQWNSRYVVVMAGKWLEILSDGNVNSSIHRVITTKGKPRLSTPFFYRPRQQIPNDIQKHFGKESSLLEQDVGGSAVEEMGKFLKEREYTRTSRR